MARSNHQIHIVLDGKDYGVRMWAAVPRKDELIMLMSQQKAGRFFTAKITQVTWGVAVDDQMTEWPSINLHCITYKDAEYANSGQDT